MKTSRLLVRALTPAFAPAVRFADLDQTLRLFADCAGRYAAVREHLWLFDGPASEVAAARRDAFADLVGAVAPDANVSLVALRAWRTEARVAQHALLSAAAFRRDARAQATAQDLIARCDRLLPGV